MALGDNRFAEVSNDLSSIFNLHAVQVTVTRSQADQAVPRDKFARPIPTSTTTSTIRILVDEAVEDIKPNESGGQPVEILKFFAQSGDLNENDEIAWNGHTFRTSSVWPMAMGGTTQLMSCKAEREIDK